ncbi:hypothetical protein ABZ754_00505 [Micromonospora purpureochromogenes]|uniref:hypothetical protein n=1 Tax=Micromonospora purpureochromogenes TaxID=47872 RepID=UPI0033D1E614
MGILLATTVAAVFGFAGTAAASADVSAPIAANQAVGVASADPVAKAAAQDPDTFAATVDAVEPYLVADRAGNLRLDVPAQVASDLEPQALAALQHSVQVFNELNQGAAPAGVTDAETFGIPSAILAFVKSNWKKIVEIAKKSGKWAWYKSVQCSAGAANALYKNYGNDIAAMAANAKVAVAIAGAGCVANL